MTIVSFYIFFFSACVNYLLFSEIISLKNGRKLRELKDDRNEYPRLGVSIALE